MSVTTNLAPLLRQQYFDSNGNPLAGGKIYSYQAGTSMPQTTYTDATGVTANTNPVILDASGQANIWLDVSLSYKFVVKDSSDVTLYTTDGVIGLATNNSVATASIQDLAVTSAKLAGNSVTSTKLQTDASIDANRSVTTNAIRDAAVTRAKLAVGAMGTSAMGAKTSAYTVLGTDDYLEGNANSAAFTFTLPAANAYVGRVFTFEKTDSTYNQITITDGSFTKKLSTQGETIEVVSNGVSYRLKNRYIPNTSSSITIAFTGFGTTSAQTTMATRDGIYLEITSRFTAGSTTTVEARAALPTGLTVKSGTPTGIVGCAAVANTGANYLTVLATAGNAYLNFGIGNSGNASLTAATDTALVASSTGMSFRARVPIEGWE